MSQHVPLGRAMAVAVNRLLADLRSAGTEVTPAELARRTGVADKTLRRRLSGQSPLEPDEFELIAEALGVSLDDLWSRARAVQIESGGRDADLLSGMSPSARRRLEAGRRRPSESLASDDSSRDTGTESRNQIG